MQKQFSVNNKLIVAISAALVLLCVVVSNTLNGGSNIAVFGALSKAAISADKIPALSFEGSIT